MWVHETKPQRNSWSFGICQKIHLMYISRSYVAAQISAPRDDLFCDNFLKTTKIWVHDNFDENLNSYYTARWWLVKCRYNVVEWHLHTTNFWCYSPWKKKLVYYLGFCIFKKIFFECHYIRREWMLFMYSHTHFIWYIVF